MVLAGDTCLVTRRTLRRHHLFRPDRNIGQLYLYALAVCARHFEVEVHAVTLMSTHAHLVLTDTHGRLPAFTRELHRLVARGTKILRKWEGPVWDHERPSVVRLLTEQAMVEKLAYVIANPVSDGLVRDAKDWPGVTVRPQALGRYTFRVRRPSVYFDPKNSEWPETVELSLTLPPALRDRLGASWVRQAVTEEVKRLQRSAANALRDQKRKVLGVRRVLQTSPYRRATSAEPLQDRNPTFATGRGQRGAFVKAVRELQAFRRAYREALQAWRSGAREVCFPLGTWAMRDVHRARVQCLTPS